MQYIHDLIDELKEKADKAGFSVWGLSKLAGIGINTLSSMRKQGWQPTIHTIAALQNFFKRFDAMTPQEAKDYVATYGLHPLKPGRYTLTKKKHAEENTSPGLRSQLLDSSHLRKQDE